MKNTLPPIMQAAYNALHTEEEKKEFLDHYAYMRNQELRGAIAQIQARNFSHNVGTHALRKMKK